MRDPRKDRRQCDTLLIEFHRYADGCVILSGTLWDRWLTVDIYEKYPTGTPAGRVMRILADFLEGWQEGELQGSDLWDQLQLPFELAKWTRSPSKP